MSYSERQYFIVTCHGWSASNWLAFSLNRHPLIACAHSSAAILAKDSALFDGDGLKNNIPRLRAGYLQRQNRPICEVYEELENQTAARHIGTVHTYRLRDLPVQNEQFSQQERQYRIVNLIRHPLDLVISGYGQFKDLFRIDINEFSWTLAKVVDQGLDIVETICDRHDLEPGGFDTLCFFGSCVVMNSLRLDLDAIQQVEAATGAGWQYEGIVRMEDVTHSPQALSELIGHLTGIPDLATAEYLENTFRQGKINIHNRGAAEGTERRWHDLEDWQKDAFVLFLRRFDLRSTYETYGYDFSFINNWSM